MTNTTRQDLDRRAVLKAMAVAGFLPLAPSGPPSDAAGTVRVNFAGGKAGGTRDVLVSLPDKNWADTVGRGSLTGLSLCLVYPETRGGYYYQERYMLRPTAPGVLEAVYVCKERCRRAAGGVYQEVVHVDPSYRHKKKEDSPRE